jgi:hypothetical protein
MTYKEFKQKFVIMQGNPEGASEIALFSDDEKNNRLPLFVDSAAQAVIEIASHMQSIAEAVLMEYLDEDSLDEAFDHFVAKASLTRDGHLYIWRDGEYEDDILYDDHISHVIK